MKDLTRPGLRKAEAVGAVVAVVLLALAIRATFFKHSSIDYQAWLRPWWEFIVTHGGYRALEHKFADYNVPYLYILVVLTYLTDHSKAAIKAVSVAFDLVVAFFVYRILILRFASRWVPALGALTVLLLPTVVLNGAMWAQCDAIYAAFALAGLYYLSRRPWLACALFGVALAFKQQAVFLFPVLLVFALRRQLPWRCLLAIPGVFLLLDIPAALIGRPLGDLLGIYLAQTDSYSALTLNAPSAYQFVQANVGAEYLRGAGILFAGAVTLILVIVVALSPREIDVTRLVMVATTFSIAVPFLLPSMHERYFYLADILSVVAAYMRPRRLWFLPILVQFASFTSYQTFLFQAEGINQQIPALAMLAALLTILVNLARELDLHSLFANRGGVGAVSLAGPPADDVPAQRPAQTAAVPAQAAARSAEDRGPDDGGPVHRDEPARSPG